jgi:hypothetical protein
VAALLEIARPRLDGRPWTSPLRRQAMYVTSWTVADPRDLMDASPAGPPATPGVSVRYDQEALVFWVVFGLVLGALVLGFCFGLAARDLRREARARRRADKEASGL